MWEFGIQFPKKDCLFYTTTSHLWNKSQIISFSPPHKMKLLWDVFVDRGGIWNDHMIHMFVILDALCLEHRSRSVKTNIYKNMSSSLRKYLQKEKLLSKLRWILEIWNIAINWDNEALCILVSEARAQAACDGCHAALIRHKSQLCDTSPAAESHHIGISNAAPVYSNCNFFVP